MRARALRGAAVLAILAVTATGCAQQTPGDNNTDTTTPGVPEDFGPVTYTVSINEPEGRLNDYAREYFGAVTERSGGKINFEYFYAGSLLPANEVLTGVGDGVADIGQITGATFPNELPIVKWVQPLSGTGVVAWPLGSLAEAATAYHLYRTDERLIAEFEANNVVPLYGNATPKADMICNKPAESITDLAGLNVRVASPAQEAEVAALGMVGVYLGTAETYEGLQRGVVDCAWVGGGSTAAFAALGWLEVAPYFIPANGRSTWPINFVMNKDIWDGLPGGVKALFTELAPQAITTQWRIFTENRSDFVDALKATPNGTFQDATEMNEVLTEFQTEDLETMLDNAPSAISDPQKFIDDYLALLDAWTEKLSAELNLPKEGGMDEAGFKAAPGLVDWDRFAELLVEGLD